MQQQLTIYQNRVNQKLQHLLLQKSDHLSATYHNFFEAMEYATLNQGKRLRPALVYAVATALGTPLEKVDSAACAIELIHSYSLVHDDLPAMDDDALRRGRPTCHIQYNEATAILVGDAQQTLAFQCLSEDCQQNPEQTLEMIRLLSHASGAQGMIAGQVMDIEAETKNIDIETLKNLHLLKTGALIQCALLLGAVHSERYQNIKSQLNQLGESIGLAFQVQDDILDIEGTTETLGKPQGSDLKLEKSTYPKLIGLENAKILRDELITKSQEQLTSLDLNSAFLKALIDYIASRAH